MLLFIYDFQSLQHFFGNVLIFPFIYHSFCSLLLIIRHLIHLSHLIHRILASRLMTQSLIHHYCHSSLSNLITHSLIHQLSTTCSLIITTSTHYIRLHDPNLLSSLVHLASVLNFVSCTRLWLRSVTLGHKTTRTSWLLVPQVSRSFPRYWWAHKGGGKRCGGGKSLHTHSLSLFSRYFLLCVSPTYPGTLPAINNSPFGTIPFTVPW